MYIHMCVYICTHISFSEALSNSFDISNRSSEKSISLQYASCQGKSVFYAENY